MRSCGRRLRANAIVLALTAAVILGGCAARTATESKGETAPRSPARLLKMTLDRSDQWRSLSAKIRLTITVHDTTASAKGHLLYMVGERYEVGFSRPYNRFLGNFYLTPDQFVYWDPNSAPMVFARDDTLLLNQLIPLNVPRWDPRDLLPVPISGRTGGFQVDSTRSESGDLEIIGSDSTSVHTLILDGPQGAVTRETVQRVGCDPLFKAYSGFRTLRGWPVATHVSCSDATGSVRFTWSLSSVVLEAEKRSARLPSNETGKSGKNP
jgi:hypothetical protein